MRVGIAADHGGFRLERAGGGIAAWLGLRVVDFGAHQLNPGDDYPDFIIPWPGPSPRERLNAEWRFAAAAWERPSPRTKFPGVRAGLIHDVFSAHQGVEDDDMNVFCLGGKVIGSALAWELIETFLAAHFSGAQRHRRLAKVQALENQKVGP